MRFCSSLHPVLQVNQWKNVSVFHNPQNNDISLEYTTTEKNLLPLNLNALQKHNFVATATRADGHLAVETKMISLPFGTQAESYSIHWFPDHTVSCKLKGLFIFNTLWNQGIEGKMWKLARNVQSIHPPPPTPPPPQQMLHEMPRMEIGMTVRDTKISSLWRIYIYVLTCQETENGAEVSRRT